MMDTVYVAKLNQYGKINGLLRKELSYCNRYLFFSQFIEVQRSQFQSKEDLRQQIKLASFIAGLQGKSVVLFVPEGVDDESMQDICSFMSEGTRTQ